MSRLRLLRAARVAVLAAAALGLGTAGHAAAAGSLAATGRIALAGALLALVLVPLSRGERSFRSIVGLLAGGQALTHLVSAFPTGAADEPGPHAFLCALTGTGGAGHPSAARLGLMVAAHLATTILCAAWLRRGERLAWQAATRLGRGLAHALAPLAVLRFPVVASERVAHCSTTDRLALRPLLSGASRRGPPALPVTT